MKKRYLVFSVIIIFVLFHFAYVWLSKGREVLYDIKGSSGTFKVKEVYNKNYKNDYSNYYIEIQSKTGLFNFEVSNSFKGVSYIIDDIKYFKNDTYECVLPIFNGNKITLYDYLYDFTTIDIRKYFDIPEKEIVTVYNPNNKTLKKKLNILSKIKRTKAYI